MIKTPDVILFLDGLDRCLDGGVGRDHQHGDFRVERLDVLEQLQAAAFGHGHVRDDHRVIVLLELVERVEGVVRHLDRIAAVLEGLRHGDAHFHFIVDD